MTDSSQRIYVVCECGRKLSVRASSAGKRAKCPNCGAVFEIPTPDAAPQQQDLAPQEAGPVAKQVLAPAAEPYEPSPLPAPEQATQCPNCGAAMSADARICVGCGYDRKSRRALQAAGAAATSSRIGQIVKTVGVFAVAISVVLLVVVAAFTMLRSGGGSSSLNELGRVTAPDAISGSRLGSSLCLGDDYLVVGASEEQHSAYVYRRGGNAWVLEDTLIRPPGFGISVSIDGERAVVAAPADEFAALVSTRPSQGSAYVFKRQKAKWVEEAKLVPSDDAYRQRGGGFGRCVSISGDYALVGGASIRRFADKPLSPSAGVIYVFKRGQSEWVQQTKIYAGDPVAGQHFGWALSIDGDYAVVGAPGSVVEAPGGGGVFGGRGGVVGDVGALMKTIDPTLCGTVYVFRREGNDWDQQAKLTPKVGAAGFCFGVSVDISGRYVVVGAVRQGGEGEDVGAAYVFKTDGTYWTQEARLTGSESTKDDGFGHSVSICGNCVMVGAPHDDQAGGDSGAVYLFRRGALGWREVAKLTASDAAAGDLFGSAVSLTQNYAAAGAAGTDPAGEESGAAYIFTRGRK